MKQNLLDRNCVLLKFLKHKHQITSKGKKHETLINKKIDFKAFKTIKILENEGSGIQVSIIGAAPQRCSCVLSSGGASVPALDSAPCCKTCTSSRQCALK